MTASGIFAGLSGVEIPVESFALTHGLELRRTFAHIMSPCLMAFSPADDGKLHPPPWRAASGGFAYDVTVQVFVPTEAGAGGFAGEQALRLFLALLRISSAPYATAPALCDMPFADAAHSACDPLIRPFEVEPRTFVKAASRESILTIEELEWLRAAWPRMAQLLNDEPRLKTALEAFDLSLIKTHSSATLLLIWSAIEHLFSPAKTELRYRLAANLASYLEPRGPNRLRTFKRIRKLYDQRSAAAHGVVDPEAGVVTESWVLLRNALMKIILEGEVPSAEYFEAALFSTVRSTETDSLSWGPEPVSTAQG